MRRILTTHAGSLPRHRRLAELHARQFAGAAVDSAEFDAEVASAVAEAVAGQARAGIDIGNNGEAPRESYVTYLRERLSGLGARSAHPMMADMARFPEFLALKARQAPDAPSVELAAAPRSLGPVAYVGDAAIAAECAALRRALADAGEPFADAFVSSPSPGLVALAIQPTPARPLEEYVGELAGALAREYRAIVSAGFILQIDAPDLAMERHAQFAGQPVAEFLAFVRLVVAALNRALAGIPRERVRLHVCWGNYEGPHDLDVELHQIWPEIARVDAGAFLIAVANPRHAHEVGCLRDGEFPSGAMLVPGVIDTTTNYVEHPKLVAMRIEEAARAIGDPGRIIAGTDCGFESATGFGAVARDVAFAKLAALVEGAQIASERLFGAAAVP